MKEVKQTQTNKFLSGATVLLISTAIVKIIGFLFTVPLVNILGGDGMGYFYSAYSIYDMLAVIASAGLPVAVSRMVSEALQKGNPDYAEKIHRISLFIFTLIGIVVSAVMFFGAEMFADFIKNPNSALSIKALSITALCAFILSSYRGYFQGYSDMIPTAVSQVIEALSKLVIGYTLAYVIMKTTSSYTNGSAGAIVGVSVGSVLAVLFLSAVKLKKYNNKYDLSGMKNDSGVIIKELFHIAIPISLGALILGVIGLIDTTMIMRQLQNSAGFTEAEANWMYGVFGMTRKLFNLPPALILSFTISIIPSLTAAITRKDTESQKTNITDAIKYTLMIAFPAGIAFLMLSEPIMNIIYHNVPDEAAAGTPILSVLGIAMIFNSLVLITNAILQSYKKVNFPVLSGAVGGLIKVFVNMILVGNRSINIMGAPIASFICYAVMFIMNAIYLKKQLSFKLNIWKTVFLILTASLVMGGFSLLIYNIMIPFAGIVISGIICIGVGVCVYAVLIIAFKIITLSEISALLSRFRRKH